VQVVLKLFIPTESLLLVVFPTPRILSKHTGVFKGSGDARPTASGDLGTVANPEVRERLDRLGLG